MDQYSVTLVSISGENFPGFVNIQRGDNIVLSTDKEVAVVTGCLLDIGSRSVTIATDRNVNNWQRDLKVFKAF